MEDLNEHHKRGNDEFKKNNTQSAKEFYLRALKQLDQKDNNYVKVCSNLSLCYLKLGDSKKAIHFAHKTIDVSPNWVKGYFRLISIYFQEKRFEKIVNIIIKIKLTETILLSEGEKNWFSTFLSTNKIFFVRDYSGFENIVQNAVDESHIILLNDIKKSLNELDNSIENIIHCKTLSFYGKYNGGSLLENIGLTFIQSNTTLKNVHINNKNLNLSILLIGGKLKIRKSSVSSKNIGIKVSGKYSSHLELTNSELKNCNKGIVFDNELESSLKIKNCSVFNMNTCVFLNKLKNCVIKNTNFYMARFGIYSLSGSNIKIQKSTFYDMIDYAVYIAKKTKLLLKNSKLYSMRIGLFVDQESEAESLRCEYYKILRNAILVQKESNLTAKYNKIYQCNFSALLSSINSNFVFYENEVHTNNSSQFFPIYIRCNRDGISEIVRNKFYKNRSNTILFTKGSRRPKISNQKVDVHQVEKEDMIIDPKSRRTKWEEYPKKVLESKCAFCSKLENDDNSINKMFVCGKCKKETYCSKECQKKDWCYHKFSCNKGW